MTSESRVRSAGRRLRILGTVALSVVASTAPAAADWLVTRDGARIETRGPWRVEGRKVLFDLPNGTLSMIRVDEVDLDKSAVATAEARTAATNPEPVAEPKKEPVLRLTEKDIPPMGAAALAAALAEDETAEAAPAAEGGTALEVISWEKTEAGGGEGVDVFGTIRNNSPNMIVSPTLVAAIYDSDGGLLATNSGVVNAPSIAAGKTANFRVTFNGLTDFAAVKFDAQGRGYKQRTDAEAGQPDESEEAEAPVESEIPPPDDEPPSDV
jgi:hypothetical protein